MNNDDNIDVTCINNAIVLTAISYQVDSVTAAKVLAKTTTSTNIKKRDRSYDNNNNENTERVSVFIDKLNEGLFVVPNYSLNNDENEDVLLKPLHEYTIYADGK